MFCGKCGTDLPENSQFCPKCGQPVSAVADRPAPAASVEFCGSCGAKLPDFSQFCLKCGQAVAVPAPGPIRSAAASNATVGASRLRRQRSKPRIPIWLLVPALLVTIWWAATSGSPGAQQFQRLFNRSHTEAIVPATFVVKSRSFSYYKFMVPRGASSVVVSGPFSATGGSNDNDIEVSLLTDTNFVDWQDGYVTSTYYSSGKTAQGDINTSLPPAAGTYYLVFSNRLSQRTAKTVQATVTLPYNRGWSSP